MFKAIYTPTTEFCSSEELEEFMAENPKLLYGLYHRMQEPLPIDDFMQLAMLGAAKAIGSYDPDRCDVKISSFIWVCAENEVKMEVRKGMAKRRYAPVAPPESLASIPEIGDDDEADFEYSQKGFRNQDAFGFEDQMIERIERDDARRMLWEAIEAPKTGLTLREHAVICGVLAGLSQSEIGEQLGISQSCVSKAYTSAQGKLKEALLEMGYQELRA